MEELLQTCDKVVDLALAAGADEVEVFAVRGKEINAELQKNDVQIAKSMESDGLGIRLFRNRSLGFSFVNSFDEEGIRESLERALGIAAAAPPDEFNGLPEQRPIEPRPGVYDPNAEGFGVGAAVEQALAMLTAARDFDSRVTVDSGALALEHGIKAISTSRGTRVAEKSSIFYCFIMGMAKEGDVVSSFDFQFDGGRSSTGFDPVGTARKFAANVVGSLGAVKGESFKGSVLLAPKATAEIISYPIRTSVRASSVQKETSRFCGKLGQTVASELLTVMDDAALADGFSTTAFDREGQPPRTLPLIEEGVLRNFIYDTYTARKEGRESTGHAGGGASAVPSVTTTNVVFSEGKASVDEIMAGIDRGVLVTRFSGNADPVSGDFSGAVKGGRMIRGGQLAEPLCGTMIAGNTFDLLPSLVAISRERERMFSGVVPYVLLDQVAVTSA